MKAAHYALLLAWLALWAPQHWSAAGHSLLTCADYRPSGGLHSAQADEDCFARPRGYKRVVGSGSIGCLVYRPGNGGHASEQAPEAGNICKQFSSYMKGGFACDPDLQRRTVPFDAGYDSSAPYAVYKRGRGVCLEWPSYGHGNKVPSPIYPQGTPYSVGPVYILATQAKADADASERELWGGGSKPFATLPYDDCSPDRNSAQGFLQKSYYNDTGPLDRARPCRGCFTIPADMPTGLWVFQWLYEMNADEWYATCWDAVISDSGDSYTAPAPVLSAPLPRTGSLGDAGVGATLGWAAAPLNQVSSSAPTCPAGLSGPLCTAGGAAPSSPAGPSGSGDLAAALSTRLGQSPGTPAASNATPNASNAPQAATDGGSQGPITATGSTARPPGASLRVPQLSGYEVVAGQELHGKFDYGCPGSVSTGPSQECQHNGEAEQLASLCSSDPNCQAFAWYQFGSGGSRTPTAWFKGGPSPQDVHAYSSPPNPDAVLFIKKAAGSAG